MVYDFQFDDNKLSDFDCIIGSFNGASDETVEVSTMEYTDIKSALSDVSHKVATSYPNNYTATIQIVKNPCSVQEHVDENGITYSTLYDGALTNDDISSITKWLVRKEYKRFKWIDDVDDDEIFYDVHCKVSKVMFGTICYGLELTFESNRPFGYGPEQEFRNTTTLTANTPFEFEVASEEEGWLYPNVKITIRSLPSSGTPVTITNTAEPGHLTKIYNCSVNEELTFYGGDLLQIVSSDSSHSLATDFNYVFPRLYSEYGQYTNAFKVNVNCDIVVRYSSIRKVGLGI